MAFLIGQYSSKLTQKGRLSFPKKFRDTIGDRLIVAKWYEGCLVIVSEASWIALLDRLTGKTEYITQPVRDTDRFVLGSAYEVELDDQGRFIVPKKLLSYANIEENTVFVGLGDRVEVWDEKMWEEKENQIQASSSELVEKLAEKNERLS